MKDEHFIAPASQSLERAGRVLPSVGSEDVSHLLQVPDVCREGTRDLREPDGYTPNDRLDWTVWLDFAGNPVLSRSRILEVFDREWLDANGRPTVYGFSPEEQGWTYVSAGGVPEEYTRLGIAWKLCDALTGGQPVAAGTLNRYSAAVDQVAIGLGQPLARYSVPPEDAADTSLALARLVHDCDQNAAIVLDAPRGTHYAGQLVWDVMLSLGLEWGDMDLFHWPNHGYVGDQAFFSVWTTTPPGYFLPEQIAAGRLNVENLVFGFSIPRSCDPLAVFGSMHRAAGYAMTRLGGVLLDPQGEPLDETRERERIAGIVGQLAEAGFLPGHSDTLYLF